MEEKKETGKGKKKRGLLSYMIGGKFLSSDIFVQNAWLFALIVIYAFIYVSNRYSLQQELNEIEHLKKTKQDLKYDVLTLQSEFSEKSRQSQIEEYINKNNSELKGATHPPYLIK